MSNAAQAAWDHAIAEPDRIALRGAGEPWTYGRLRERAAAFALQLTEAAVAPGDRVLLVAPGVPEFAAAYLGIHAAGAVAVTVNTMSTRPELEYKVPRLFQVVDELPKGPTGKILKRAIDPGAVREAAQGTAVAS